MAYEGENDRQLLYRIANNLALLVRGQPVVNDSVDTDGNLVPTNKAHTFAYDSSGNLVTDTVTDGVSTWVRTYTYRMGAQVTDSGWVKQ